MRITYKNILKPTLFLFDPEKVHETLTFFGDILSRYSITRNITAAMFSYQNPNLKKTIKGITFENPIGLAAGYDYEAKVVKIMKYVGFGFNTVGTITTKPYGGNSLPRLVRMPKSKSILVNKGFKNYGVYKTIKILNDPILKDITFGVSVGSSNIPEINTIDLAIADILECYKVLETSPYIKYYELNISCPNTAMAGSLTDPQNFEKLILAVAGLNISRPIFIKMPNEIELGLADELVKIAMENGFDAFIFSNLVKSRENPNLDKGELEKVKNLKGNFSGKPTFENSNKLLKHFREMYKDKIVLVGCGGVFTPEDAKAKLETGADLIQLITGMIYEGPQLIGQINRSIAQQ